MADGVEAVAQHVKHVERNLEAFKEDQGEKWKDNRETHKDLYAKLDRLPTWATLAMSLLTGAAGFGLAHLLK